MASPLSPPTGALGDGPWQGAAACRAALAQWLCGLGADPGPDAAGRPGAPPMQAVCVDRHFGDWPFDDAEVQAALAAWLRRPGRRLRLIALDFATTARQLPRFARWRRDFAHCIEAWQPVEPVLPAGLRGAAAGPLALQWLDQPDLQLRRVQNPVALAELRQHIADYLQQCEPAWPVTTLGL